MVAVDKKPAAALMKAAFTSPAPPPPVSVPDGSCHTVIRTCMRRAIYFCTLIWFAAAPAPALRGRGAGAWDLHLRAAEGVGKVQAGLHGWLLLQELLGLQARLWQLM